MSLGDISPSLWVHFFLFFGVFFFEHFLILSGTTDAPGSFCIFIAPAVESTISPRSAVPFIAKCY